MYNKKKSYSTVLNGNVCTVNKNLRTIINNWSPNQHIEGISEEFCFAITRINTCVCIYMYRKYPKLLISTLLLK